MIQSCIYASNQLSWTPPNKQTLSTVPVPNSVITALTCQSRHAASCAHQKSIDAYVYICIHHSFPSLNVGLGNEAALLLIVRDEKLLQLVLTYRLQLFHKVVKLMRDQISHHGSTLSCIEDILRGLVLKRRTDNVIAKL